MTVSPILNLIVKTKQGYLAIGDSVHNNGNWNTFKHHHYICFNIFSKIDATIKYPCYQFGYFRHRCICTVFYASKCSVLNDNNRNERFLISFTLSSENGQDCESWISSWLIALQVLQCRKKSVSIGFDTGILVYISVWKISARTILNRSIFIREMIENDFQKAKTFFMVESIFLITILSFDRYWSITRLNVSIPHKLCNSAGDNQFQSPTSL